jgi:hypothetical protein
MRKGAFTRRWFKPIPDFPNYWINKRGQVYSIHTKKFVPHHPNTKYYARVQCYNEYGRKHLLVHRIVAKLFKKNPDPKNKTEVNHIDFNKMNPHADNLNWMTPAENKKYNTKKIHFISLPDNGVYCPF